MPEEGTKRHQARLIYTVSELTTCCKCGQAEREYLWETRGRAGTAVWPQMCPTSQPTISLPPSQQAVTQPDCESGSPLQCRELLQQFTIWICFCSVLPRQATHTQAQTRSGWTVSPKHPLPSKASSQRTKTCGCTGGNNTKTAGKKYRNKKKPQGKGKGARDRNQRLKN